MITVNIYYTGKNGNAQNFAREMEKTGTADRIRAAKGNLRYEYFIPMNDPETVLLIDCWEDQASLDRHHASPMMKTIAALREMEGDVFYAIIDGVGAALERTRELSGR